MSEMVERVARALWESEGGTWPISSSGWRTDYFDKARAALNAFRDPTPEMRDAFWRAMFDAPPDEMSPVLIGAGLDAMIDAALAPSNVEAPAAPKPSWYGLT